MQVITLALAVAFDCVPPNALIVLDRSGSMEDALPSGDQKWTVAVGAVANLARAFDDRVRFGIGTFPDGTVNCTTGQLRLPVADAQGEAVASYVTNDGPDGDGTPIGASLRHIASMDPSLADDTRANFVILVTDGEENCAGDPAGEVQALRAQTPEVRTFVVGFGAEVDAGELNAMADAGGTARAGAIERYYQADDPAALDTALNEIAIAVTGGDPEFPACDPSSQTDDDGIDGTGGGGGGMDEVEFSQATGCGCRTGGAGKTPGALGLLLLSSAAAAILCSRRGFRR